MLTLERIALRVHARDLISTCLYLLVVGKEFVAFSYILWSGFCLFFCKKEKFILFRCLSTKKRTFKGVFKSINRFFCVWENALLLFLSLKKGDKLTEYSMNLLPNGHSREIKS